MVEVLTNLHRMIMWFPVRFIKFVMQVKAVFQGFTIYKFAFMVILSPQYLNVWMTLFFTFLVSDKPFTFARPSSLY